MRRVASAALLGLLLSPGCAFKGSDDSAASPGASLDLGLPVLVEDPVEGVCVSEQLDRWDAERRELQIDALLELGVREIRQDLVWSHVQASRDAWDWSSEDAVFDAAAEAGLELIAMLGYGNPWATSQPGADTYTPPDDPADFARFAAAAAERYAGRVRAFEIWNEPNAGYRFWKVGDPPAIRGDPRGYGELFVAAAEAIHAVDPHFEVQVGGTFYHPQLIPGTVEFLEGAIETVPGFLDAAQAIAWHPYPQYPPRVPPETSGEGELALWEMVASLRAIDEDLPLPITEMGWPSWNEVDEEEQAAWIVRELLLAQAEGIRDVCVYTLEDGDNPAVNPERAFGLLRMGPGARKPSGEAWAAMAAALEPMSAAHGHAADLLGLPEGVLAVRYTEADRAALTWIWNLEGGGAPVVTLPGVCPDGSGAVVLQATPTPTPVLQALDACEGA
jgi:hypothetical protein